MKSFSTGLQAHLDDGATMLAWCWRIARADGFVGTSDARVVMSVVGSTANGPNRPLSAVVSINAMRRPEKGKSPKA